MKKLIGSVLLLVCLVSFCIPGYASSEVRYNNDGHCITFSMPSYSIDDENGAQIFYKIPAYNMLVNIYAFGDRASEKSREGCLNDVKNGSNSLSSGVIEINDGNIIVWDCSAYSDGSAGYYAMICQLTSKGGLFSSAKYRPVFSINFQNIEWWNTTKSFFTNERFYAATDILESIRLVY